MRELFKLWVVMTLSQLNPESVSAAPSESKNKYCEAVMYGTDLDTSPSLFGDEFKAFSRDHPQWRTAVSWGIDNHYRMRLGVEEPITHRYLPMVPLPQDIVGTQFSVATASGTDPDFDLFDLREKSSAHGMGLYSIAPLRTNQGAGIKYALKLSVSSKNEPLKEVDLITLYVALTAVPYADHMVLEQRLTRSSLNVDEVSAMRTVREAKFAGILDSEALNLVVPKLVRSLMAKGEPFKFEGRRHIALKAGAEGNETPSNLFDADHVFIQYHFAFRSLIQNEVDKSKKRRMN